MWLWPREKKFSIEKALHDEEKSKIEVRFKARVVDKLKEKTTSLENSESAEEYARDLVKD